MSAPILPPHDADAEQSLLGALLVDRDAIVSAAHLTPDDFYTSANGLIFQAVQSLYAARTPADLVTVKDELARMGQLDRVGGVAYVASLLTMVPTAVHAPYYADLIANHAMRRRLIQAGTTIARLGYDQAHDVDTALMDALQAVRGVDRRVGRERGRTLAEALPVFAEGMEMGWNGECPPDLVPTGFYELDKALNGGFERGQLVIIAARPSMGKTAFALQLAKNAAKYSLITKREPEWTLIFSAEMTLKSLLWRAVAEVTGIPASMLKSGAGLSQEQRERIMDQIAEMLPLPIWIDDSSAPTAQHIRQRVERFAADRPVRTVMFDYLEQAGDTHPSEEQRISKVAAQLKAIGKDTDTTMIALSQLNRKVEDRPKMIPNLADLRWSGRIEQEADIVMFLYRQDYYEQKEMITADKCDPEKRGVCDVIIAKQRDGVTPKIPLLFVPELTSFRNLDRRGVA